MANNSSPPAPKCGIPAWQRTTVTGNEQQSTPLAQVSGDAKVQEVTPGSEDSTPETKDHTVVQHAKMFLQDDTVRDERKEKKIAFLESKGLSREDIDKAIALFKEEETVATNPLILSYKSQLPSTTSHIAPPSQPQTQQQPPSAIPPIITYPEFLVRAQKAPPLVTTTRLINTAYVASAAATIIYGLTHYLIGPMTDNLTAARHEFAENAREKIDELNERLAEVVSVEPTKGGARLNINGIDAGVDADTASDNGTLDSDPTELFHRDYGTQTSPDLDAANTTKPTTGADTDSSSSTTSTPHDAVTSAATKLHSLESHFKAIIDENANEGWTSQQITSNIESLKTYLDGLIYPAYSYTEGVYSSGGSKKEDDEIARVKSEIRGVKGSLLSAKSFPGAAGMGLRGHWPVSGGASRIDGMNK